jgi:hypothetical protein
VVTQQGTIIMASFMQDQLEHDMKRNELVQQGKLSQHEADEQAEEWEKVRTKLHTNIAYLLYGYRCAMMDGYFTIAEI